MSYQSQRIRALAFKGEPKGAPFLVPTDFYNQIIAALRRPARRDYSNCRG